MSSFPSISIGKAITIAKAAQPELNKLKKATDAFETVFVKNLLTEMQKGIKKVSLGDSAGKEVYEDMMNQAVAESVSKGGSLGIGKMLYKEFAPQILAQVARIERSKEAGR